MQVALFIPKQRSVYSVSAHVEARIAAWVGICLIATLVFDATLCLMVGHSAPMTLGSATLAMIGDPAMPNSELPATSLPAAQACQHAHSSVVLLALSLLLVPLLQLTSIALPSYGRPPQIAIPPLLPPP